MVEALIALLATLGALVPTGLLISRAYKDRLLYLIAWSVTLVGITLALLMMALGFLLGFNDLLFKVAETGAALIAPLWLALGMVELIARYVQVRFAAWLFTLSYTVVAIVILLADPLTKTLDKSLPKPGEAYDALPLLLIDGGHVVAVISLVACAVVTALLAGKQDREAAELLIPVALVALAGVLVVAGTRGLLPSFLAVLMLAGAAGLVWYGAMRTIPVYEDDGDYDDEGYDDRPATGYDEQPARFPQQAAPVPAAPEPAPREDRRFPEPVPAPADDLRFPEPAFEPVPPAAATGLDGLRGQVGDIAAAGLPGLPGPPDLSAACGQITVYTLLEGREEAFDRLAADLVAATKAAEPDTMIFACHQVENAPTQRIFYWLFRDEGAFTAQRQQPHWQRFKTEARTHVLTTNVIELKLSGAKLAPLPAPAAPGGRPVL
ncbi:putative quinol monooxygenase [Spirillospora sp. NPDC050679]